MNMQHHDMVASRDTENIHINENMPVYIYTHALAFVALTSITR